MKSGSGSSLKNIFRAPVVTWMSSHLPSFRSSFSSGEKKSVSVHGFQSVFVCVCVQSSDTAATYNPGHSSGMSKVRLTMIYSKAEFLDHS